MPNDFLPGGAGGGGGAGLTQDQVLTLISANPTPTNSGVVQGIINTNSAGFRTATQVENTHTSPTQTVKAFADSDGITGQDEYFVTVNGRTSDNEPTVRHANERDDLVLGVLAHSEVSANAEVAGGVITRGVVFWNTGDAPVGSRLFLEWNGTNWNLVSHSDRTEGRPFKEIGQCVAEASHTGYTYNWVDFNQYTETWGGEVSLIYNQANPGTSYTNTNLTMPNNGWDGLSKRFDELWIHSAGNGARQRDVRFGVLHHRNANNGERILYTSWSGISEGVAFGWTGLSNGVRTLKVRQSSNDTDFNGVWKIYGVRFGFETLVVGTGL